MNHGGNFSLHEIVEKHHTALVDDLMSYVDSRLQTARDETSAKERLQALSDIELARAGSVRETRLSTAESLNQGLRRIRQAPGEAEALAILLESSAPYSQRAVVLKVENTQVRSLGARGIEGHEFSFPLESAAAVASVCESRDPVIALASDTELSPALAAALAAAEPVASGASKVYLFPIVARHEAAAVLVACGEPVPAALELLSEAAGMKIEALEPLEEPVVEPAPQPGPELVQIVRAAVSGTDGSASLAWGDLSPDDQKLHLQAQRVARVKVAEMRLYHAEELRKGVSEANIYGALTGEIDSARAAFLQTFLSKSPTMVDYLHLEILRSLAHDDDRILGQDYPGPMV